VSGPGRAGRGLWLPGRPRPGRRRAGGDRPAGGAAAGGGAPGAPEPEGGRAAGAGRAGAPAVQVRRARHGDLDAVVALFASVAAEGRWIAAEAPIDRGLRRRQLRERLDRRDAAMFVAEVGGVIVGQLVVDLAGYGVAEVGMLVAAEWRRRGVGSALLGAGIAWAREAGAHKVALQVWPHNQAAITLYERFGFQREGLLRRHYRRRNGELWDALVMGLPLDRPTPAG
jgi:RimJ/RimL family protein N-acetyltransferase